MVDETRISTPAAHDAFARQGMPDAGLILTGQGFMLGMVAGLIASSQLGWDFYTTGMIAGGVMGVLAVFVTAKRRGASLGQALAAALVGPPFLYFMKRRAHKLKAQSEHPEKPPA